MSLEDFRRRDDEHLRLAIEAHSFQPLHSADIGDPFFLKGARRDGFPFYVVGTGTKDLAVLGSFDAVTWEILSESPIKNAPEMLSRWAPCVYVNHDSPFPYTVFYSQSRGEHAHERHEIRVAAGDDLASLVDRGSLTADLTDDWGNEIEFAIDPDLRITPEGAEMFFASDFIPPRFGPPFGTGIWRVKLDENLMATAGKAIPVARPKGEWQRYESDRRLPWIPRVGDKPVDWYTMEGPSTGISLPTGEAAIFYSGGNFGGGYAVGLLTKRNGEWADLSVKGDYKVVEAHPDQGLTGIGHTSTVRIREEYFLMAGGRFKEDQEKRHMCWIPLIFNQQGLPIAKR